MHRCFACGSDRTYMTRDKWPRQLWRLNHDRDNNALCGRCYSRYITSPYSNKRWNKITNSRWRHINNPRRQRFLGERRMVSRNPRTGECKKCGSIVGIGCRRTLMHHMWYDQEDILKGTIELCVSCHMTLHNWLRHISKLIIPDFS